MINFPKLFVGPMSKNIVDSILSLDKRYLQNIGFIPSRRQIEYNGGYVNNWTTEQFYNYVNNKIIIERDHGGPHQGYILDEGKRSFFEDAKYMNIIHIDPWKKYKNLEEGCLATKRIIEYVNRKNKKCLFEIATEQSIKKFECGELDFLVNYLRQNLKKDVYEKIVYLVIQSGTSLKENQNIGMYNSDRLKSMVNICKKNNLLSKEHNGDYLGKLIKDKFKLGLDSINIAPEFGVLETNVILNTIKENDDQLFYNEFYKICFESKRWVKWVDSNFIPENKKDELIKICGHYVFSNIEFIKLKSTYVDLDIKIQEIIKNRVKAIIDDI